MSKNISLVFEAVISVFNFTAEQAEEWLDENSHLINLNKVTDLILWKTKYIIQSLVKKAVTQEL